MAAQATILIPGIKGTKLLNSNEVNHDTIWSGIQSNFESIDDLALTKSYRNRYYDEALESIIQPSEVELLAYGELVGELRKNSSRPVYIFNYDWRYSNVENGERLQDFIGYLIAKSKARRRVDPKQPVFSSFDFITHSMGNQVFRSYLNLAGFRYVNKAVLAVPPFLGSLEIISGLIKGEGFFAGTKESMRKLVRTWPGALELLPRYAGVSRFENGALHNFYNLNHWQDNLVDIKPDDSAEKTARKEKLKALIRRGKRMVEQEMVDLDQLSAAEKKRILIVVRDGYKTMQSLQVLKNVPPPGPVNLFNLSKVAVSKDGDGAVAHASSCCYARPDDSGVKTVALIKDFWANDNSHGFVLNEGRLQRLIQRFLYSAEPFDHRIPGNSVREVAGVNERSWGHNLSRWELVFKD
ncbi:esterase/lipase family protein [Pontiella agarivorans]|uniref:Alpha/beta hydrolase n=1 Tax=Pontiella agarivorans TaxID=3038953 RepID=A0ABU5MXV9_9BACT|nr:hypothetical protein [Pontiella agarivorans]MDZ8119017.1 hypothetical protein [Pontiella agarivorans]